jgi:formylglycine-generating enzyme required for sulfatase activity
MGPMAFALLRRWTLLIAAIPPTAATVLSVGMFYRGEELAEQLFGVAMLINPVCFVMYLIAGPRGGPGSNRVRDIVASGFAEVFRQRRWVCLSFIAAPTFYIWYETVLVIIATGSISQNFLTPASGLFSSHIFAAIVVRLTDLVPITTRLRSRQYLNAIGRRAPPDLTNSKFHLWMLAPGFIVTAALAVAVIMWPHPPRNTGICAECSTATEAPPPTPAENHDELAVRGVTNIVAPPRPYVAGRTFRDCADCPEMVAMAGGEFTMGSPTTEAGRSRNEGPLRRVSIRPVALGKYDVTFDQWAACVHGGGCTRDPGSDDFGGGNRPVIRVTWNDAEQYVHWLSQATGKDYRLPSEAEWEYAARAGTTTPYFTGESINPTQANFNNLLRLTQPVGSYAANAFGLYDMAGNVMQWAADCSSDNYNGAPTDGSATTCRVEQWGGMTVDTFHVLRGGAWDSDSQALRSAYRYGGNTSMGFPNMGFRVARTL